MTEESEYITDAVEMMGKGYRPVIQFEPPSEQIVETSNGYEIAQSLGWVKLSAFFRENMLAALKGAKLSVFICICLHVNERGEAFPGIDTIAKETDLHRNTVMETIAELEEIPGLLQVIRKRGKANRYRPSYAARGTNNEPPIPVKKTLTSPKNEQTSTQVVNETLTTPVNETLTLSREKKKKEGELLPNFKTMEIKEAKKLPTLQMYEKATEFFPGSLLWERVHNTIIKHNLTFEKIQEAAIEWELNGYRKENVKGVLDWAVNGIPQKKTKGDTDANSRSTVTYTEADYSAAERIKARKAAMRGVQ